MKDLANPDNEMSQIIPLNFHDQFDKKFLQLKLKQVAPMMDNPPADFRADIEKVNRIYDQLAVFLVDPCRRTGWCPPRRRIEGFLDQIG
jgi:hypothetical protein